MSDDPNTNKKQPGEREPGTFHYNPGNMSGKKIGRESNQGDRTPSGDVERTKSAKENLAETARGTSVGSELIKMTRNSPLGFLAGAALTGIVIGVFLRGGFNRA